jgi:hypothetical protein
LWAAFSSTFCAKAISICIVTSDGLAGLLTKAATVSGTYSHRGTNCRSVVASVVRDQCLSTFLHPFAPPALPGFSATMSALTPVPGLELAGAAQVSLLHVSDLQSLPSPTTSPPPLVAFAPNPSAPGAFSLFASPGFALQSQARQSARPNRVRFSYGRLLHLTLLPTPPRGDAVTFSYRPEWACLKGTSTLPAKHACSRTTAGFQPAHTS